MGSVLAHAAHWLETLAFALPPLLLIVLVLGAALIARRQEGARTDNDREAS